MAEMQVLDAGVLTLVEDLGRPGHAAIGLGPSGALDRGALRLANRLVGNAEDAAGLEILLGPVTVRFDQPTWFAVTGAWGETSLDDTSLSPDAATLAPAGGTLVVGPAARGIRFYLAVRGGIDAPVLLGSRSSDLLSGLGPAPVASGDTLSIDPAGVGEVPVIDFLPAVPPPVDLVTVRLHPGPRAEWFTAESRVALYEREWLVSPDSDRVGTRLNGDQLERLSGLGELPSEAMVAGAIQVPPSGLPTVLLADHPVTGGYPVIAVVADASLDAFAQLRPGQALTFRHARP